MVGGGSRQTGPSLQKRSPWRKFWASVAAVAEDRGQYLQELWQCVQHRRGPHLQAFVSARGFLLVSDVAQVQDGREDGKDPGREKEPRSGYLPQSWDSNSFQWTGPKFPVNKAEFVKPAIPVRTHEIRKMSNSPLGALCGIGLGRHISLFFFLVIVVLGGA